MMEILRWKQGQIWEGTDVGPGVAFDVKQLWGIGQVILPLWATVFICKMTGFHWRNSNKKIMPKDLIDLRRAC